MKRKKRYLFSQDLIIVLLVFFLAVAFVKNFLIVTNEQFIYLADSFLHGKLYFLEEPGKWLDCIKHGEKFYWPLAPFPAVILVPFVALFGKSFHQGYLQFFLIVGTLFLIYRLAKFLKFSKNDSLWLAFAFLSASVFFFNAMIPYSWYFSQVIIVFLYFLSFWEYFHKKRPWLIGLCFAFILATRMAASLGVIFFVLEILSNKRLFLKDKFYQLVALLVPIGLVVVLLFGYNYARFGNFLETGYGKANELLLSYKMLDKEGLEQFNYGLFHLKNIPRNLYYYFLKIPDPVQLDIETPYGKTFILKEPYVEVSFPGISFFVMSPFFLYFFKADFGKKLIKMLLLPIALIQFILLTYYFIGWLQMGPRYMLDFLPMAFLVVLFAFKERKLQIKHRLLILASAFLNLYLFSTMPVVF